MAQHSDKLPFRSDTAEMNRAQLQAGVYLQSRKIYDLFNFLIGHLLVEEPEDPVEFMVNLLDKCMLFRAGLCEPPLLFNTQHIESMFRALDPSGTGAITMVQYRTGLMTLGITRFEESPPTNKDGNVEKQTFIQEARQRLVAMLAEMLEKH
ncbi:EF-hand calcium-binding domain-containing protein 10-like [Periplaneta americana]|uniref:EF-hand calcium-binding domain-containing protein 10-like n=1 Tax=Periplaneta americana TaxID=6978 RepID=UPI0037E8C288